MVRRTPDVIIALALGGLSLALYVATLAPSVMPGDSAECQYAAYLLYLVHPTGYPLYLLLGWAWSHLLPMGDVAYRLNLFSAFWAALTVAIVYLLSLKLLARTFPGQPLLLQRMAAGLGAVSLAVSETFWNRSLAADIRTFHAFFVALLIYLLLRWAEDVRADRWLLASAFVCGLSLAHHRTTILLLPGAFIFVAATFLQSRRQVMAGYWFSLSCKLIALMLLPLLLYLYIPLRGPLDLTRRLDLAPGKTVVLYESTFQEFRDYVLGFGYTAWVLPLEGLQRLASFWERLLRQFALPGVALGGVGLLRLMLGRKWSLLFLTGMAFIFNTLFALSYFVEMRYLYIPAYLIFALWIALGGAALAELAGLSRLGHRPGVAVLLLLFLLPLTMFRFNYPLLDQSHNYDLPEFWGRVLAEPIPQGAILVGNDRNEMQAMWYYQYVEGRRPDLINLFPGIGGEPAFNAGIGALLDEAIRRTDRPIFLVKSMPGIEVKVKLAPFGSLYRVVGSSVTEPPQRLCHITLDGALELVGYDQVPRSIKPGKGAKVTLYWHVLRPLDGPYSSYVHLVDSQGRGVAQHDHVPGNEYYPTSLWRSGEILADEHIVPVPGEVPTGVYNWVVGVYRSDNATPLGQGIAIGKVAVKDVIKTEPGPMMYQAGVNWGGAARLLGYDLEQTGDHLQLTLHWRAERLLDEDYTVFIHLLDEGGEIVAQGDSQPQGGAYPTSVWDLGEVVNDPHQIALSPSLPAGRYRLAVGMYRLDTGERLPVFDSDGRPLGNSFTLTEAQLQRIQKSGSLHVIGP
jgi:hypothetical protein